MSFMDKAKAAAELAKVKAQEGLEDVQLKKELASRGAISHPEIDPLVQKISKLEESTSRPPGGPA